MAAWSETSSATSNAAGSALRVADRRRGIGTALVETMRRWMEKESIEEVWVLADNRGAEDFYASCGFVRDDEQGVLMTLTVSGA
jgi:GNAT superfamily N-acetyltransferase